jgi:hypothetical protein
MRPRSAENAGASKRRRWPLNAKREVAKDGAHQIENDVIQRPPHWPMVLNVTR